MTQSTARAAWKAGIWTAILAAFLVLFFGAGGAEGFAHDRGRIVAVAILFLAGYAAFFTMLWFTRSGNRAGTARDERDDMLEGRAGGMSLTVVLVYVYLLGIILWVAFQEKGSVPAGWMWFLAYSTVFLGMISHGVLTLLIAGGKVGDGEG